MHANEAFDSITAPIRGAQRGLLVHAVFGHVMTFRVKDDGPAGCAPVLALIRPDVRDPLQPATALRGSPPRKAALQGRVQWSTQQPR
jgi:hypothetical protein